MPKHKRQQVAVKPVQRFDFTVKTIRAISPKSCNNAVSETEFIVIGEFNCGFLNNAKNTADRMQEEFDEDGDPCRTYVYREKDPVPVYAGLSLERKQHYG